MSDDYISQLEKRLDNHDAQIESLLRKIRYVRDTYKTQLAETEKELKEVKQESKHIHQHRSRLFRENEEKDSKILYLENCKITAYRFNTNLGKRIEELEEQKEQLKQQAVTACKESKAAWEKTEMLEDTYLRAERFLSGESKTVIAELTSKDKELSELKEDAREQQEEFQRIVDDDRAKDEIHCGCCVELRSEVKKLTEENEKLKGERDMDRAILLMPEGYVGAVKKELAKDYERLRAENRRLKEHLNNWPLGKRNSSERSVCTEKKERRE